MEECYGCNYYIMGLCCCTFEALPWEDIDDKPLCMKGEDYGEENHAPKYPYI